MLPELHKKADKKLPRMGRKMQNNYQLTQAVGWAPPTGRFWTKTQWWAVPTLRPYQASCFTKQKRRPEAAPGRRLLVYSNAYNDYTVCGRKPDNG